MTWKLIIALAGVVLFLAFFQNSIKHATQILFLRAHGLLTSAIDGLRDLGLQARVSSAREMERNELGPDRWRIAMFVWALFSTVTLLFLLLCDFEPLALAISAMGFGSAVGFRMPFSLESVLAFAALASGIYAAAMWKILGEERSSLVPLHHFSPSARRLMRFACMLSLVLIAGMVVLSGIYRAESLIETQAAEAAEEVRLAEAEAPSPLTRMESIRLMGSAPETVGSKWKERAVRVTMSAIPLGLLLTSSVAFTGVMTLVKLLYPMLMGAVAALAWLLRMLLTALRMALEMVGTVVMAILGVLIVVATLVARPPITLLRLLASWAGRRLERPATGRFGDTLVRAFAGLVGALTSWSWETQLPDRTIGGRPVDDVDDTGQLPMAA